MADNIRIELELDDDYLALIYKLFSKYATVVPDTAYPDTYVLLDSSTLIPDPNFPNTYTLSLGSTALIPDQTYPNTYTIGAE